MRTTTNFLLQILAFTGGMTFASIFITKSETWNLTLPIFLTSLLIMIADIILHKNKK